MQSGSHSTWIGTIRQHIEAWRKASGWSRETMALRIVEAHERIGGPAATGIVFDPPTRDAFERAKVMADRIFRWLDDATKDTNLLPPNFQGSLLEAMPIDRRVALLNDLLRDRGVSCRALPQEAAGPCATIIMFKSLVSGAADATNAIADLLDGIEPGELERAQTALAEVSRHVNEALLRVEATLADKEARQ